VLKLGGKKKKKQAEPQASFYWRTFQKFKSIAAKQAAKLFKAFSSQEDELWDHFKRLHYTFKESPKIGPFSLFKPCISPEGFLGRPSLQGFFF
jgi:hypothetical protein